VLFGEWCWLLWVGVVVVCFFFFLCVFFFFFFIFFLFCFLFFVFFFFFFFFRFGSRGTLSEFLYPRTFFFLALVALLQIPRTVPPQRISHLSRLPASTFRRCFFFSFSRASPANLRSTRLCPFSRNVAAYLFKVSFFGSHQA